MMQYKGMRPDDDIDATQKSAPYAAMDCLRQFLQMGIRICDSLCVKLLNESDISGMEDG